MTYKNDKHSKGKIGMKQLTEYFYQEMLIWLRYTPNLAHLIARFTH